MVRVTSILPLALLASMALLAGCAVPMQHFFQGPKLEEELDGNYRSIAACAYQRLGREGRLRRTDHPEQRTVRIALTVGAEKVWELSFADEDGGRQTRLEVTSPKGSFPSEHILATVRACAA